MMSGAIWQILLSCVVTIPYEKPQQTTNDLRVFDVQVSLAGSVRLEVTAWKSGHFWRRTDDGRHRCIWHRWYVRLRFFFVGTMYWPCALTKPVHSCGRLGFPWAFTNARGGDETAFVEQIVAPRMVALAYAKVSHSGDGFEELSVNNSFIFLSHAVALYRL